MPEKVLSLLRLAYQLRQQMRISEAVPLVREALSLEPHHPEVRWLTAELLLLQGEYLEGFQLHRARTLIHLVEAGGKPVQAPVHLFAHIPLWNGEDLTGRNLFVWLDWGGIGDQILFMRYLRVLRDRYPSMRLYHGCPQRGAELVSLMGVVDRFITSLIPVQADYQIPLLDLPIVFGTIPSTIPYSAGYVSADPQHREYWRLRTAQLEGGERHFRIGICWATGDWGQGQSPKTIPLHLLLPLTCIPGVHIYSLQKGPATAELTHIPLAIRNNEEVDQPGTLQLTAALIEQMDLMICADTGIAHLSAALGKKTLILLRFESAAFWGAVGEHSPWYSSVVLLRQAPAGNWSEVAGRLFDWCWRYVGGRS